ncbi:hypothetical protein LT85_0226 [Collimonas arenae]|uniref:Uncharacterized protein n=1 Tax=Collimonas arenae TaxID=279058 RepID=A0A0A1F4C8_9BURK|nr:hypothetical protein LT85_0226 [Collimonas arenae]
MAIGGAKPPIAMPFSERSSSADSLMADKKNELPILRRLQCSKNG